MLGEGASLRASRVLGLLLLGWLLLLAWHFYLERTATQDSAFFSWLLIDTRAPYAALGRAGSWLAQAVPLALIWSRAPLDTVLRGYSVSLIGVHILLFWLVAFRLKDERATIALPIALVAASHLMFYYGISELYQGLSVLLLVWALADRCWKADTDAIAWRWGLAAFIANVGAGFFHQLLVLPLFFLLVYEAIAHGRYRQRRFLFLAYVLISLYAVRSGLMPATEYEQGRMPSVSDILYYSSRLHELPSTEHLLQKGPKFKSLLLLVGACAGVLVAQRKWLLLLWTGLFSAGFVVLILITDRDGKAPIIYENYYPVLAWVWGVVLADRWGTIKASFALKGRWVLLATVLVIGGMQVWRGHYLMSAKVDYLERLTGYLRANGIHKGIVDDGSLPWILTGGSWPLAFESALVSGCHGPLEATTLYCSTEEQHLDTMYTHGNAFLGPNWMPLWFTSDHLTPVYFIFHQQGYSQVNTSISDSTLRVVANDISMLPEDTLVRMLPDRYTVVHVRIANRSAVRLGSLSADGRPLRLRYRLYDEKGTLYAEHALDSELEADIPAGSTYMQGLLLERPVHRGRYKVEAELTTDVGGGTGVRTSFWIEARRF